MDQTRTQNTNKRLLRLEEVLRRIPVCRSGWYEGIRAEIYPKGLKIGKRTVAWLESDIDKLITEFKEAGDSKGVYKKNRDQS